MCVCACVQEAIHGYVYVIESLQSEGLVSDPRPFLRQDQAHPTSHHTRTTTTFSQERLISSSLGSVEHLNAQLE